MKYQKLKQTFTKCDENVHKEAFDETITFFGRKIIIMKSMESGRDKTNANTQKALTVIESCWPEEAHNFTIPPKEIFNITRKQKKKKKIIKEDSYYISNQFSERSRCNSSSYLLCVSLSVSVSLFHAEIRSMECNVITNARAFLTEFA